ncbi:MAG TPA: hypothetical protein VK083_17740 [Nocardia sp.]|uniref:hypothetical protein n=1 Tax=Nocardia sp. TaxID=1821 RepID=UPI002B4B878E|nr:hypothetical protein [Nocardia sp.]HLS78625.1 hypothetical protein [Nocardia sp.]
MNAAVKFAGFGVGLAAVFGIALGIGALVGPTESDTGAGGHGEHGDDQAATAADTLPGGLLVTDGGYTLDLENPLMRPDAEATLRLRVLDERGEPLTRYTTSHDKDLHLILVRRDLTGFQHVHPTLGRDGAWTVPVDLARAGAYRVFADFVPEGGQNLTLGADLLVAGTSDPKPLPPPATTATVGEYTVTLDGTVTAGAATTVTLSVARDGQPVTDLEPYLGAYGHLVALRAADLAYLHVHPEGHPGDGETPAGPGITFTVTAPSPGDYRLYLDFKHRGEVRTAEFTVSVPYPDQPGPAGETGAPATPSAGTPGATPSGTPDGGHGGHGH